MKRQNARTTNGANLAALFLETKWETMQASFGASI